MNPNSQRYSKYFTYIKPVTKLPIVKNYGSTIFSLLIITIFIFYAIKPTIETILVLQKKLDNSNEVFKKISLKAANLAQGKQNYENLDPSIKSKLQALIPDTINLKSITQTLEQSARIHDASISALQIQPLVVESKIDNKIGVLTPVGFTFNLEGDYGNLISVLQDLRSSGRLISIDNLSLSNTEESGIIMIITGKAYYIK